MTLVAGSIFGFSLLGIIVLFFVKRYEVANGVLVGGARRESADLFALRIKWVFLVVEWYLSHVPDFAFLLSRKIIRTFALFTARAARNAESNAYRVADLVSHKRNFERKETKSDYLKQMTAHKNENGGTNTSGQL